MTSMMKVVGESGNYICATATLLQRLPTPQSREAEVVVTTSALSAWKLTQRAVPACIALAARGSFVHDVTTRASPAVAATCAENVKMSFLRCTELRQLDWQLDENFPLLHG